jgi:hypothetical protein
VDHRVLKLKTIQDCEALARNARARSHPDLALQAEQRAVELQASSFDAKSEVERACIEAVCAYERVLTARNGRTTHASRTWQMIKRHGVLTAVERIVTKREDALGYTALVEAGLGQFAFEAVVLRHPTHFSAEALAQSRLRLGASDL